ncbi:DUF4339 domain-containing protein [Rubritalea tangerina]|uniref:DUF4339 domain-containing protein n=1 Tax=Rubritalea tangerina TaxID=430798 RepID=A0ABW4ZFI1_9BACT
MISCDMWYYTLKGEQAGPISQAELAKKLNGELPSDTLVWHEGMHDWTPASEMSEFRNLDPSSPPPLHQPSPPTLSPYATPRVGSNTVQNQQTEYPLPHVKRANYALLIIAFGSAFVAFLILFASLTAAFIELVESTTHSAYQASQQEKERLIPLEEIELIPTPAEPHSSDESPPPIEEEKLPQPTAPPELPDFSSFLSPGIIFSAILMLATSVWGTVLGAIYVYRAWVVLQPAGAHTTPGKAAGFLFIPLFNFYWAFIAYWKWAEEWNLTRKRFASLNASPQAAEGPFLAMAICQCVSLVFSLAGLAQIVLYFVGMKSMCDVINYAAENAPQNDHSTTA